MANKPVKKNLSAEKRVRQSRKRHERNQAVRNAVKTLTKKFNEALVSSDKDSVQEVYGKVIKLLNKASSKGIIHRNNASRRISNISKKLHKFISDQAA
ncbi:MAG: 30S ribosomal protein S20 [Nitrospirota bacterium]|nr:MAG: 30S ribosomal protein S20 [Nitrospirota bacterium]